MNDSAGGELACQKSRFEIDENVHYLNCAYLGPLPRTVAEAGVAGIRRKLSPAPFPASEFFHDRRRARDRFARLVGAESARIALMPSASYGIATAVRNLPLERGQNVVILGEQFPSNVYAWRVRCAESGCELRTVARPGPPPAGSLWNERLLDAIGADTAVVALPHCHWTDGTLIDLEAAGRKAREVGAALVVDASQSIGALPFDVGAIRPDALVTVGYKWLMGPYSTALGYFGPRFDGGTPLEETWLSRPGSGDFQTLANYSDEYRAGAARYDVGQSSNFILLPMLVEALDTILELDPARIGRYAGRLLAAFAAEVRDWGWPVEADEWRARHMMGVHLPPSWDIAEVGDRLAAEGVYISLRGNVLRISPNVYNEPCNIDALRDILAAYRA